MDGLAQRLAARFSAADLEWKPQTVGLSKERPWIQIVPYIAARAVYQRLDEVFGVTGWSLTVRPETIGSSAGCIATLTFYDAATGRTVTREDGAEPTDIEGYKGAISGAVKRVAVTLGIGRYLYDLDGAIYGDIGENGTYRARGKLKSGETYDFKWSVPPAVLARLLPPPDGVTPEQMQELAGVAEAPVWTAEERAALVRRGKAMQTQAAMASLLEKAIATVVERTQQGGA